MSQGKSIKLFLADGTPGGIITAEIINWTGHVISAPRSRLAELLARPEAARPGLYVLVGEALDGSGPQAYIGETENLGDGWGVNGHVGHLFAKDYKYKTTGNQSISYTDWKVGVTKDVGAGWIVGASYVGTNAQGSCNTGEFYCFYTSYSSNGSHSDKTKDAGRDTVVLSVSKTF